MLIVCYTKSLQLKNLIFLNIFIVNFAMEKKGKCVEKHIIIGLTSLLKNGAERTQCVLCNTVLSAESMQPLELKRHLETKHCQHTKEDATYFCHDETQQKRQRLDNAGSFHQQNVEKNSSSSQQSMHCSTESLSCTCTFDFLTTVSKTTLTIG